MMYEVKDPAYEVKVRESFGKQAVMTLIGASLLKTAPGEVTIELPFRSDLTQQNGFLHAGILATVLDSACGYSAFTLMPPGAQVLSIEFKINLMSPAIGEKLIAKGHVVRAGRTVTVCDATGFMEQDNSTKAVAKITATMMTVMDMKRSPSNDN